MTTRVLMIGPGSGMVGGISALVETLVSSLEGRLHLLYLPTVHHRQNSASGKISLGNILHAFSQYVRFLGALHTFHPKIIHLHTSQGIGWLKDTFFIISGRLHQCRVIVHFNAADFDELYGKRNHYVQSYTRWILSISDAVIAVSSEWGKWLSSIVPTNQLYIFHNCVAVESIPPHVPQRTECGLKALFIGSIGPRKGAFDLIEALGYLKAKGYLLQTQIVGFEEKEGEFNRAYARIKELNLENSCELLGVVVGEKKKKLLYEADMFILPTFHEGLPLAIVEAMAAGLPIITTPISGIPDIVQDGLNGFLVPPRNKEMLAEKMALLIDNSNLRETMGQRSREIAESRLDVKPYVERLLKLYESIASI